jgi:hypothetical protein
MRDNAAHSVPFQNSFGQIYNVHNSLFSTISDPKLPKELYARVLKRMLVSVEEMRESSDTNVSNRLAVEAEDHFLHTLVSWGTTRALQEHIHLHEFHPSKHGLVIAANKVDDATRRRFSESLHRRYEQTAVGYLDLSRLSSTLRAPSVPCETEQNRHHQSHRHAFPETRNDSLYDLDELFRLISQRIPILNIENVRAEVAPVASASSRRKWDSRVALDALAKLYMMKGEYEEALRCFLILGALHAPKSLPEIEEEALDAVNESENIKADSSATSSYSFVVRLIEKHHLHQSLLESRFLPDSIEWSPISALIALCGLDLMSRFLIEHCIAPQQQPDSLSNSAIPRTVGPFFTIRGERRGTLPMDLVADQLRGNPKLLLWYLHHIFVLKPEIYVIFPNTANPPLVITQLYKEHLDLYIKYAGLNRDSARVLSRVEYYRAAETTTPLLSFLKVLLQLGVVGPVDIGKILEVERKGGSSELRTFAMELAYVMENFGNDSANDARLILDLYLKGCQSLMLAVSYAQRAKSHSKELWDLLLDHCLYRGEDEKAAAVDGSRFGLLLEAAALSGADLANLVAQIPPGMQVEGLRPRLVAAILDYRLKVKLYETSSRVAKKEKDLLFCECAQRARRGMRCDDTIRKDDVSSAWALFKRKNDVQEDEMSAGSQSFSVPRLPRIRKQPEKSSRSLFIPIR